MSSRRQRDGAFAPGELHAAQRPIAAASLREVLHALVHGWCLGAVVPIALARVERDPLTNAGWFEGDLMRGLMEVPGSFWGTHPRLYDRYREALRASAALRRRLPTAQRMIFWSALVPGDDEQVRVNAQQETKPSLPRDG
jgi:hypothetical protein